MITSVRVSAANLAKRMAPPAAALPAIEPRLSVEAEAAVIADREAREPTAQARRERVRLLLRRGATPTGDDAALIALLADRHALPLETREDRMRARQRLHAIGSLADPPRLVGELCAKHGVAVGDGDALAEALLPHRVDYGPNAPGTTYGVNAGGGFCGPGGAAC